MNLLQSTTTAALFATTSLLTGSATQAAPVMDAASFAEVYGLPLNAHKLHFNKANQTGVDESCELVDVNKIRCTLDVKANEAMLDYRQIAEYTIGVDGALSIETHLDRVNGEWTPDTFDFEYKPIRDGAIVSKWSAGSPLAHVVDDGSERVVQNTSKTITLFDEGVDVRSSIPVNDIRGFDVHTIFNHSSDVVQSFVVPRVSFDNVTFDSEPKPAAQRDMNYGGTSTNDGTIMDRYIDKATKGGGYFHNFPDA